MLMFEGLNGGKAERPNPAETLSSFVSHKHGSHMFLFKASRADYRDWLAPSPTPRPTVEGRPFLSTTLLIFHRETSPFSHSLPSPCQTVGGSSVSVFIIWICLFGHESSVGVRCSPPRCFPKVPSLRLDCF